VLLKNTVCIIVKERLVFNFSENICSHFHYILVLIGGYYFLVNNAVFYPTCVGFSKIIFSYAENILFINDRFLLFLFTTSKNLN